MARGDPPPRGRCRHTTARGECGGETVLLQSLALSQGGHSETRMPTRALTRWSGPPGIDENSALILTNNLGFKMYQSLSLLCGYCVDGDDIYEDTNSHDRPLALTPKIHHEVGDRDRERRLVGLRPRWLRAATPQLRDCWLRRPRAALLDSQFILHA